MTTAMLPSAAYDFEAPANATAEDFSSIAQRIIAESRGTRAQGETRTHKPEEYMYWKVREHPSRTGWKKRAGWIILGPGPGSVRGEEDVVRFSRIKEADPLYQFGSYEGGGGGNFGSDGQNPLLVSGESSSHPYGSFTELFQKRGGIEAVPKTQLVALGFHRKPEIRAARPDVADVVDYECPLRCSSDASPTGVSIFSSQSACDQHMSVVHKQERQSELAARINADAINRIGERVAPGVDPNLIAAIVSATVAAMNGAPVVAAAPTPIPTPEPVAAPEVDTDSRSQLIKYVAANDLPLPEGRSVQSLTKDEAFALVNAHRQNTAASD